MDRPGAKHTRLLQEGGNKRYRQDACPLRGCHSTSPAFPGFASAEGLAPAVPGSNTGISFPMEKWVRWESRVSCEPKVPLRSC